jgi:acyl carrier protein
VTPEELTQELERVFISVFSLAPGRFSPTLSMDDVPEWDSIAHVMLVLGLESTFGVQFDPEEAGELTSVRIITLTLNEHGIGKA